VRQISVEELAQWRAGGKHFVLLDVRDEHELRMASLPESVHIPMREIPARFTQLDRTAEIAVLCHHGGRSAYIAHFLSMQGFANVHNIAGGIDAYSKRIDKNVPRY
jgi:rhodanese-related sulfurtransferase